MSRKATIRERRMADPEYMADLRQRFYLLPARMSDGEVYDLCGDTLNAALVEADLTCRRLKRKLRKTFPCRVLLWAIDVTEKGVRWLMSQ